MRIGTETLGHRQNTNSQHSRSLPGDLWLYRDCGEVYAELVQVSSMLAVACPMASGCEHTSSASSSLLLRVQGQEQGAWDRLTILYSPVVYSWARQCDLQHDDAADITQEVFFAVSANISRFRRDSVKSTFRGWMWTITRNKVRDHFRRRAKQPQPAGGTTAQIALANIPDDPPEDSVCESPEALGNRLVQGALQLIRSDVEPNTWTAFWRYVVDGHSPPEIAEDLGISVWSVYQAKSRILRSLKAEFSEIID